MEIFATGKKGDLVVFKKGNIPWNKGRNGLFHHTEEHKKYMSEKMKGLPSRWPSFAGHSPWNKGRTGVYSEETLEKKRQQMLGNKRWLGRKHPEETKRKISEAHKGRVISEETKEKLRQYCGERASFYGRRHTKETKHKMRVARLNRKPFPQKDTRIEKLLHKELLQLKIPFKKHVSVCGICQPDIVFPELKIAVFADGDYWHSKEFKNGKTWKKDRVQDQVLKKNGWLSLRFWGSEIKKSPEACAIKMINAIKERI